MSSQILDYPSCENLNDRFEGVNLTEYIPFGFTKSSLLVFSAFEGKEIVVFDSNLNIVITRIKHPLPIIDILVHNNDVFGVLDNEFFFTQYSISNPSSFVQKNRIPLKGNNEKILKLVSLTCDTPTSDFQPNRVIDFLGVLLYYTNFLNIKMLRTVRFTSEPGSENVEEISSYQTDSNTIHLVPLPFPPIATFIFSMNPDMNNNPFSEIFRVKGGRKVFKVANLRKTYDRIVKTTLPLRDVKKVEGDQIILLCLKNQDIGFHCSCDLFRVVCEKETPQPKPEKLKGLDEEKRKRMLTDREFLAPFLRLQLIHRLKLDYSVESAELNFTFFQRRYFVLPRGQGMLGLADVGKGKTVFFWDTSGSVFNTSSNENSGIFGSSPMNMMSTSGGEIAHCYILPNGKVLVFEKKESAMVSFDDFDPELFRKQTFMNTAIGTGGFPGGAGKAVDLKLFDIYGMFKRKMMTSEQLLLTERRIRTLLCQIDPSLLDQKRSHQQLTIPTRSIIRFDLLKIIFENDKGERKELITFKSLFDLYLNFEVVFATDGRMKIARGKVRRPYSPQNELLVRVKDLKIMYLEPVTSVFFTKILLGHNFGFIPTPLFLSYYYLFSTLTLHNDRIYRRMVQKNPERYPKVRKVPIRNCFFLLLDIICKRVSEMEDRKNVLTMFVRSCKLFEDVVKKARDGQEEEEDGRVDVTMLNRQVKFRCLLSKYCFARLYKLSMSSLDAERHLEFIIRELFGRNCVMPELTSFEQSVSLVDSKDISFETNYWRAMMRTKPLIHDVDEEVGDQTTTTGKQEENWKSDQKLVTLHLKFFGEEEEDVSVEVGPEFLIRSSNFFFNLFMIPNSQISAFKSTNIQNSNNDHFLITNNKEDKMEKTGNEEEEEEKEETPDLNMNIDLFLSVVKYFYNPKRFCRDEKNIKQLIELLIFSVVHDEYGMRLDISSVIQTLSKTIIVTESQRGVVSSSTKKKKKKKKKKKMKDEDEEDEELEDLTFVNVLKDVTSVLTQSDQVRRFLVDFWGNVSNYSSDEIEKMILEFSSRRSSGEHIPRIDYSELVGLKWGGGTNSSSGASQQQQQSKRKQQQTSKMKDEDEEEEDETEGETEEEEGEEEGEEEYEEGDEEDGSDDIIQPEEGEEVRTNVEEEEEEEEEEPQQTMTTTTVPTTSQSTEEEKREEKMVDEDEEEEEEEKKEEEEEEKKEGEGDGFGFKKVSNDPNDPFSFNFNDFKFEGKSFFEQNNQQQQQQSEGEFKFVPLVETPKSKKKSGAVEEEENEEDEKKKEKDGNSNDWFDFDKPVAKDWNFKIE